MRIGAAAEQAGVNVQTLRYYEEGSTLECPIIEALDGTEGAAR